jgi:MutS domain V
MISKYSELVSCYSDLQAREQKKSNLISVMRLIIVVLIVATVCFIVQGLQTIWIISLIILIIAFMLLVNMHENVSTNNQLYSCLVQINQNELKYLQNKEFLFNSGEEYCFLNNQLNVDIDLFGNASLFHHLNRSGTYFGKERLAQLLVNGLDKEGILSNREAIQELVSNLNWCQKFRAISNLFSNDQISYKIISDWSNNIHSDDLIGKEIYFYIIPLMLWFSLAMYFFSKLIFFIITALFLFVINLLLLLVFYKKITNSFTQGRKIYREIEKCRRLIAMIEESTFNSSMLEKYRLLLVKEQASKCMIKFANILDDLETIYNPFGLVVLNGLFLYNLHTLVSLSKWNSSYQSKLSEFVQIIGEFDALISLSNFSFNNPSFKYPEINNTGELYFEGLSHPLIDESIRVSSDISFLENKIILLTGSNMSGKSTFIRAIGVNLILAKVGLPICVLSANIFPFSILSCMRKTDSLKDRESYFLAELKSLKVIMDQLRDDSKNFVILDEILKGTNSRDKCIGTIAVIEKLISLHAVGVIATHDLEVCELANKYPGYIQNKCFEVTVVGEELVFDYKLRDGICTNTTASLLMKKIGIID